MGQKLRDDKIGALSHSGGVITLTSSTASPSWLTIGGQQYRLTSNTARTIATDVTMTTNARYQIFAVVVGGVVQLRVSSNENSVGPTGFLSWKLVGSFQSNRLSAFGSFNNIKSKVKNSVAHYITAAAPSASPVLSNTVLSTISFPVLVTDTEGNYNTATGEYIVPFTGTFNINFRCRTTGSYGTQGNIDARLYKNGALWREEVTSESASTAGQMRSGVDWLGANLVAGDVIVFRLVPSGWSSVNFINASVNHWMTIEGVEMSLSAPIEDL